MTTSGTTAVRGPGTGGVTGSGLAEIKPDNGPAIRKGLYQLRAYLQQSEAARASTGPVGGLRAAWMRGSEPQRSSVWLLTYRPWPDRSGTPSHVRVFAHELKRDELLKKGPLPSLDRLLISRRELPKVELPKVMPFPSPRRADMFGLAVESLVRERFGREFQRPGARRQRPGSKGPDVLWRELEELFRELAEETGDSYWREVADELAVR